MNMAISMGLIFMFFRRILIEIPNIYKYDIRKFCAILAIVSGGFYLCITGFPVSAVRAYIMTLLYFVGILLDKQADSMRFLCFSAFILLLKEPNLILNIGFQLSFLAVLGLMSLFNLIKIYTNNIYLKPLFYIINLITTTLIAELYILPLSIYHFNSYNLYSILANSLAIPLTTFIIIPFITISVFLFPFGLEKYGLIPVDYGIDLLLSIAKSISNHNILVSFQPLYAILTIIFGLLWFSLWEERWRYYGFLVVFIGILCCIFYKQPTYYFDERDDLEVFIKNNEIYFSNDKNKFKNKTIMKKFGKKEYKILDK
jgi:competence protein ComEC